MTAPVVFPVSEIFGPTIQGEGELIGIPTLFVRFGGCDSRCSWCDSLHAVLPEHRHEWERLDAEAIRDRLLALALPPYFVTLSGGNPALHRLGPLVGLLKAEGYLPVVETQGTKYPDWLMDCSSIVLSPKPPSSGEQPDLDVLARYLKRLVAAEHPWYSIKVVVFDDADLVFADVVRGLVANLTGKPLVLQVGNPYPPGTPHPVGGGELDVGTLASELLDRYEWLANRVLALGWCNVRVLPQLHTLVWGNARAK